ncbi:unnamed protein product [Periconia digitata]|uniref:Aminoglycoside phosphotransferase domain-containing protein n=1 Tax=Periconia digitata TaxID=1303443 RepID=A0A9W4XH44_9PLEO|nr:unnamed protein product [Periconia digitata]
MSDAAHPPATAIPPGREEDCEMIEPGTPTSTVMFEQEPYETFKNKIVQLCKSVFGMLPMETERMQGGSYNRVVGISVEYSTPSKSFFRGMFSKLRSRLHRMVRNGCVPKGERKYVVRMRRGPEEPYSVGHDVATLNFVRKHTLLPIADVIAFSNSTDSCVESPYMIQTCLPGQNLKSLWTQLTHKQRGDALRQITLMTHQLQYIESNRAGVLKTCSKISEGPDDYEVEKFDMLRTNWSQPAPISTPQTTFEFLMELWEKQLDSQLKTPDAYVMPQYYKIRKIILSLRDLGFLSESDLFTFAHTDLFPRNVLAQITSDSTVQITGILDWDASHAFLAPKIIACRAPFYFWHPESAIISEKRTESLALVEPSGDEDKEMKKIFESCAGPEWLRYAFTPEFVIARRVIGWLMDDHGDGAVYNEADDIIRAWRLLHHQEELESEYFATGIDEGGFLRSNSDDVEDDNEVDCSSLSNQTIDGEHENANDESLVYDGGNDISDISLQLPENVPNPNDDEGNGVEHNDAEDVQDLFSKEGINGGVVRNAELKRLGNVFDMKIVDQTATVTYYEEGYASCPN